MKDHFKSQPFVHLIAVFLFCAGFTIFLSNLLDHIIDDSYITFQYVKNFSEHFRPWYNLDPEYQGNGQTSLLWLWTLTFFKWLGFRPEYSFYTINLFFGFYLIYQLVINQDFKLTKIVRSVFSLGLCTFFTYWLSLNASHGLESVLAAVVLYLFLKNWDKTQNYWVILLPLVRPEFFIFAIFWIFDSKKKFKVISKKSAITGLGVLAFALFYLVSFDFYIPLSLLHKSASVFSFAAVKVYIGYLVLFSPLLFQLFSQKKFFLLFPLIFLVYYYTFNIQSYSSGIYVRYLFPLMAYYIVFKIEEKAIFKIFMVMALIRMADISGNLHQSKKGVERDSAGLQTSYYLFSQSLKPTDNVIVIDAGYTAYHSKAKVYDGLGLNDATLLMARKNHDCNAYRNYIEKKEINIFAMPSINSTECVPINPGQRIIFDCMQLKSKKPSRIYPMDKGYYLFEYHLK